MIEEFMGIEKPLFKILFFLKKNLKTTSISIIPIGIAYSKIPANFRGEFCLSFGEPIAMNDYLKLNIKEFNIFLNEKMIQEEEKALKNVGR